MLGAAGGSESFRIGVFRVELRGPYSLEVDGIEKIGYHIQAYLGIPLDASWKLWSNRHFQFYVSGGVMLEKCLNDKPWQWSVDAAVGAEYVFIRQLGFYVEPSIGYYFNDGTSLQHYYKERPWAPSIDFGIRLHLTKPRGI